MAPIIYKRQGQILDFIKQHIQLQGGAPTLREIANAIGVSSLATVHEHLQALEAKNLIKRKTGKSRSIELIGIKDLNLISEGLEAPILGFIAAGAPIEPYFDPNTTLSIPTSFASQDKRIYVLQVRGESMIDEQIRDGDFVIIEQRDDARNGEIVVALLDNGMATLKRFFNLVIILFLLPQSF